MIEQDTVKLLRECDAGIKMGVKAIGDVRPYVNSDRLGSLLDTCEHEHDQLKGEVQQLLNKYQDDGKNPNPIAKGMSFIKTNLKMAMDMDEPDDTIADLITDGCNMGVKSLSRYLNQYAAADENSKNITKRLIREEEQLCTDLRQYL